MNSNLDLINSIIEIEQKQYWIAKDYGDEVFMGHQVVKNSDKTYLYNKDTPVLITFTKKR